MAERIDAANQPGMGAILDAKEVTFRVWAPHAEEVFVIGTFNGWRKASTPLASEQNGYWSTAVPGVRAGDEYRYLIHTPVDWHLPPLSRIDPYARKVTNSLGNGIVYDPRAFNWGGDNFKMASGNELVVYEMHVGTFNVKAEGHPGTFDSAVEKVPYLKELGINAIEVMPQDMKPADNSILTINGGLSSIKFALFDQGVLISVVWVTAIRRSLAQSFSRHEAGSCASIRNCRGRWSASTCASATAGIHSICG